MPKRSAELAALEAKLGYIFQDRALLTEALTHVSSRRGNTNNQRLEFLGDRVLGLAASDMLLRAYPTAREGDLARRMSELVRGETCAAVGLAWDLGPHLKVSGGSSWAIRTNPSAVADACEAVIGAIYLDAGFPAALAVVERFFGAKLADMTELPTNPKARLQEWAAARGRPTPTYEILERTGPDHAPSFHVVARVHECGEADGHGPTRRMAEQAAAEALMAREGIYPLPAPSREGAYA